MIKIQKAKKEDIWGMQDVFYKAWLVTYPNERMGITKEDVEERFKSRHSDEQIRRRIRQVEDLSENNLFLIAKDGNDVIGVCKLEKEDTLNNLGTMFWKRALEFFDREKDIIVNVDEYNTQAISFYKKLGFVDTGKRFTDEHFRMPISGVLIQEMQMIIKKHSCNNIIEK